MTIEGFHVHEENLHNEPNNLHNEPNNLHNEPNNLHNEPNISESNPMTSQDAETGASLAIESVKSINDIQMLNDIIEAFNNDEKGILDSLRIEYNKLTDKIMKSYNAEIKKVIEKSDNNSVEDMGSKESTKPSSVETEEKPGDFSEISIIRINGSPLWAERLSSEILKPQPKEVMEQSSDISEVLEKGSEQNKKILRETISEVQGTITHLYYAAGLDKRGGKENLKRAA